MDVQTAAERWSLTLGEPYEQGLVGIAIRAALPDGTPVVLKVFRPGRESEHEADALAAWDGDGAVRLLARDDSGCALLLERCVPGTPVSLLDADAALDIVIGLLPRLWVSAGDPFHTLADEAAWWSSYLPARWRGAPRLLDAALDAIATLAPTQGEHVLLHQDLHGGNVLAAQREPWLVIDPKPLAGEREFAVAPVIRSLTPHSRRAVLHRFDRLTSELGLDRERARGWTIAQAVAWTEGSLYAERNMQVVRWLLEAR